MFYIVRKMDATVNLCERAGIAYAPYETIEDVQYMRIYLLDNQVDLFKRYKLTSSSSRY